jgi:hypothetical protein
MSIVIPFAPRAKPVQANLAVPSEPAQILFFTGVRYERQAELKPIDRQPRRRGRPSRPAARATIAGHPV